MKTPHAPFADEWAAVSSQPQAGRPWHGTEQSVPSCRCGGIPRAAPTTTATARRRMRPASHDGRPPEEGKGGVEAGFFLKDVRPRCRPSACVRWPEVDAPGGWNACVSSCL